MKAYRILLVSVLMLLAGCQSGPEARYTGWIGQSPSGPAVDLADYEPPQALGVFRLQGEMSFPEGEMRVFRYRHAEQDGHKLDVALYPLPSGWSDLPGERAVAGHYGQVKQTMAGRVTERNNSSVELISEELRNPDDLDYPVAEGVFRETTDDWNRTLVLEISARKPVFVRMTSDLPGQQEEQLLPRIRAAMDAFLRHEGPAQETNGS